MKKLPVAALILFVGTFLPRDRAEQLGAAGLRQPLSHNEDGTIKQFQMARRDL